MRTPHVRAVRVVCALVAAVLLAAPVSWPLHAAADGEHLLSGLGVAHYVYDTTWSDSQLVTVPGTSSPSGGCVISAVVTGGEAAREVALDPTTCAFQLEVGSNSAMPQSGAPAPGAAAPGLQGCVPASDLLCWQTQTAGSCAGCNISFTGVRALRCPLIAVSTYLCRQVVPVDEQAAIGDEIDFLGSSGCITSAAYSATQEWTLGWKVSATSWSYSQPSCTQVTMSQTSSMLAVDPDTVECLGSQVHLSDAFTEDYSGPGSFIWGGWSEGPAACSLEQAYITYSSL